MPQSRVEERKPQQSADRLFMESTLLRVAGVLFCHDAKSAAKHTEEIRMTRGDAERHIFIRPDPKLGQPGPLAHKIFVALLKKHSDYGRPIQREISFTRREIGRLIGRREWGGRDSEQLARALHEIHYTFIRSHFKNAAGRHVEHSFNIFPEILIERREFASDPIEACTITLAEPIVQSLVDEHFTCLNYGLMQELSTIGQALYMRAFFHFANLYSGRNRSRLAFQKRYDDMCVEWLGGLTIARHESKIKERLAPHLDALIQYGFLKSYRIAKAKAGDRPGFVISFEPGEGFFRDYDRFYRNRQQGELQWEFAAEQREIAEPMRVAYQFIEKKTGQQVGSQAYVSSKDVETAKQLLAEIPFADMAAFLDFALAEAKRTGFDIQTLGGVRQYLAGFKAKALQRQSKAADRERAAEVRAQDDERLAYDRYRAEMALEIFAALPAPERQDIDEAARIQTAKFGGSLANVMADRKRAQITAERHGGMIKSFGQWKEGR